MLLSSSSSSFGRLVALVAFATTWMMPFVAASPTESPSMGPTATASPSMAPTDDYQITTADLEEALDALTEITVPLIDEEFLSRDIPFIGKSMNELIGGASDKSIASLLDFSSFVANAAEPKFDKLDLAEALIDYMDGLTLGSDTIQCSGADGVVEVSGTGTTIVVEFCAEFTLERSATLDGSGLFDNVPAVLEVDLDVDLDVAASLQFKAQLTVDLEGDGGNPAEAVITVEPIVAELDLGGVIDITVGLGMLDVTSSADASAFASVSLEYCDGDPCPQHGGDQLFENSTFYVNLEGNFSLEGGVEIGSDFPGLDIGGDASFSIVEDNIFDPAPVVNVSGFDFEDFITFSPDNAIAMLRLIDSTFVRAQENEAFEINIPLTDTSVAKVLGTGSVLTTSLLALFQKVEPFEDREPTKSLFLTGGSDVADFILENNETLQDRTYEFYVLIGDDDTELNVNPDNQEALRSLIKDEGILCSFNFTDDPTTSSGLVSSIKSAIGLSGCGLSVCDAETDCSQEASEDNKGTISGCACQIAFGTYTNDDGGEIPFIASVAYDDMDNEQDIQLIGFMHDVDDSAGVTTVFDFPVNQPAYPALIPRFRNFLDFANNMSEAILDSANVEGAEVVFSYSNKTDEDPAQYSVTASFSIQADLNISLNASLGVGDLLSITVEDPSSVVVETEASFSTTFGVILEPDDTEQIVILGNACDGAAGYNCSASDLDIKIVYVDESIDSDVEQTREVTLNATTDVTDELSKAMVGIANVSELGTALLFIQFDSDISSVTLSVPKNCSNADDNTIIESSFVMECNEDQTVINVDNDYGLTDQVISKRSWQIAVGETSIEASFTVTLEVFITSNVGDVIEVTADLEGEISGNLTLSLGTDDLLAFTTWLAALTSVFDEKSEGHIDGFFVAEAFFDASFSAKVEPSAPFNLLATATAEGGFVEPFELDFLSNETGYPNITFDVNVDGIGDVRKLTFAQVVAILADALEWLVGSSDDDSVESCSGGLLGKEIGGNNVFTYQVPVLGISVCGVASFLQVLVEAIETLIDETSEEDGTTTTTFSSLDTKLTTLLQDSVGGFPTVNISSASNSVRSDLTVELELYWNFSLTESLGFDMSSFFSDEEIEDNAGLEFFANALLPGEASATIEVDGSLRFTLGVGLEYVNETGEVNPYILGTTGLEAELSSSGDLEYEAAVGAFQGTVEAGFDMPLSLSVGLDDEFNYYLSDPGEISSEREGFTNVSGISGLVDEIQVEFAGSATANVSVGLSLLGLTLDVDVELRDLNEFFLDNRSDSVFKVYIDFDPPSFDVPSLLDLLLADPQGIIDALDDVFETAEEATLGDNGVITNFPIPFIRNSLASSLGAKTDNNVLAQGRRKIIPALQEGLDGFEGETDTVADVLARLMENGMDLIGIRQDGEDVEVICYEYNKTGSETQENVSCTDEDADITSIMWDLPFGQSFEIEISLDFDLDAGSFPLEISFGGDDASVPTLVIGWCFNLAFGFDEDEGFFLFTYPDDDPEISVEALLQVLDRTIDATLIFLKCVVTDLDLEVGAGLYIDMDKASALRIDAENATDPQRGRLTRADFRKIVQVSDLFIISATAAATVEIPDVSFEVNEGIFPDSFDSIADWLPRLEAEIYVQARKEFSTDDDNSTDTERRLVSTHRRLEKFPALDEHPTASLFRSLSVTEEGGILDDAFEFPECELEDGETFCAKVYNLTLNMEKIAALVSPILSDITNSDKDGYLDDLVGPLIVLDDPLPGVSDVLNRDISVLDIAEAYIGKNSGVDTVRTIVQIYKDLNELVSQFVDNEGLLIASECDILDNFNCSGGVFDIVQGSRRRRLDQDANGLFDMRDQEGLFLTPMEAVDLDRSLGVCDTTFKTSDGCAGSDGNAGNCDDCSGTQKITCRANLLSCRGRSVEGLSFPFMSDLVGLVGLLSGGDIELMDFTPPEMTFAFEYGMFFILYTPPSCELTITFEFTARLKVGFVLDSKGIREAIEQIAPLKAFNSFALRDTFDGVDEAMITLTASVTVALDVSAAIVKVGVSGGITFIVTVDLFDPYPETSNGLFRPFELLASGSSPLEWFEFGIEIFITISIYVKIGLFIGPFEITLFQYSVEFTFPLIDPIIITPGVPTPPITLSATGVLTLSVSTSNVLECTSLSGSLGEEEVECILGDEIASYENVKTLGASSDTASIASTGDVLLRDIASKTDVSDLSIGLLTLDYEAGGESIFANDESITITETGVIAGTSVLTLDQVSDGLIVLPKPEMAFLTTTIGDCKIPWELDGHTNLVILAYAIQSSCTITATGGESTDAILTIDFGFDDEEVDCTDGNVIELSASSTEVLADITRKESGGESLFSLNVGNVFKTVEIKGSACSDTVKVKSTLEEEGFVAVFGGGGNDTIVVGTDDDGLDNVFMPVALDGGNDNDTMWINDYGSSDENDDGELSSGSVVNLLHGLYENRSDLDYENFEEIIISLSEGSNDLLITSTAEDSETFVYAQGNNDIVQVNETQGDLYVYGGSGNDTFKIYGLGDNTTATIYGEAGVDKLLADGSEGNTEGVNTLDTSTLRWSGGDDNDDIDVILTSAGTGETNIDLFDDLGGINSLNIDCVDFACVLLSRENFIANIHNMTDNATSVERINLDRVFNESEVFNYTNSVSINSIVVRLNQGENEMHFDDTMAPMNVFGGDEADSFYFGQLYNSERDSLANVAVDDPISTTLTTKGYLSDGNSHSLSINGGDGDDFFDVLRNRFLLDLNGDSDDDTFVVRSFLILDVDDEGNATNTSLGDLQLLGSNGSDTFDFRGDFDNATEDAEELADYVVNSLVDIDGGTGNDRLVVVGTEADDSYVVTDGQVFGGGLTISYTNIEALEVTGEAGDDLITILSTSPSLVTYIYGSLGSDTFVITPRTVDPVISKNLRGHRGILEHTVESDDSDYDGLLVEGVAVDVLDNDGDYGAYVNVIETEAVHVITEGSTDSFSFWVYPTVVPANKLTVQVAAQTDINGNTYLLLNNSDADATELVFDQSMEPQLLVAKHNTNAEPLDTSDYNLLVKFDLVSAETNDDRFILTEQTIRPIDVKLLPNALASEAKSVTLIEPLGSTTVAEGDDGFSTEYEIYLRPCSDLMKEGTEVTIEATVENQVNVTPFLIDNSVWGADCKVTVLVEPVVDSKEEGLHFVTLTHLVRDPDGNEIELSDESILYADNVLVRIYDDEVPGVIIRESLDVTSTAEIDTDDFDAFPNETFYVDEYSIRLSKQPAANVTVTVDSIAVASDRNAPSLEDLGRDTTERIQVLVGEDGSEDESLSLVFTPDNWFSYQWVRVIAKNDAIEEGVDYLNFPSQPSYLAYIQGPIIISGDDSTNFPDVNDPVMLPGENETSFFELSEEDPAELAINEKQVDTLMVYNLDVLGNEPSEGVLTTTQFTGYNMGSGIVISGEQQKDGIAYEGMEVIEFYLGGGVDSIEIEETTSAIHYFDLGADDDELLVKNISGHFIIQGGEGGDSVNVSSDEATLVDIQALLVFDGGDGDNETDTLRIFNTGDSEIDEVLNVTRHVVEVSSMEVPENTTTLPLNGYLVNLRGSNEGSFKLEVTDTVDDRTDNATFDYDINSTDLETALQFVLFSTGEADSCGENSTTRCSQSVKVYPVGDAHAIFFLGERLNENVSLDLFTEDLVDFEPEVFQNKSNDILERISDIAYFNVEELYISMGSQDIVVNVRGTTAETFITTQDSDDSVFISSEANQDISNAGSVDFLHGWLDYIENDLHVEVANGRHRLMISDESSNVSKGFGSAGAASLDGESLTDLSDELGDIYFYATGGNWFDGVTLWLGKNDDQLDVVSIPSASSADGLQTTTSVNCGSGDDNVTIALDESTLEDVVFVTNAQAGDDTIDGSASSLPIILFGDAGNDTLTGGSGNDIIIGDFGRVAYRSSDNIFNPDDVVEAIFGGGGYGDFTDGAVRPITDAYSTSTGEGGGDKIDLGSGDDVAIGGAGDDEISGGDGRDIIFGDSAEITFDIASGFPESLTSLNCGDGGSDTLYGGIGDVDYLVGGTADDEIYGNDGPDLVFGDHASITLDDSTSHKLLFATTIDEECAGGDDLIVLGEGDDLAFGGAANDEIYGDEGQDVILGDFGEYDADSDFLDYQNYRSITDFPNASGSDLIHGGPDDDFILGQEGEDEIYGDGGNDDIYGGHQVVGGHDGGDKLSGGDDEDVILGDNGEIVRTRLSITSDYPWVNGMEWLTYASPFGSEVVRDVRRYDDIDYIQGDDEIYGNDGNDILHGQRGDDSIDGGAGEDEIYGELGSDTLLGGSGNDIIIGDIGLAVRRYDESGNPLEQLDTTGTSSSTVWHKDIVLEELGNITGVDRISNKIDISGVTAEDVMSASLLFVANAFTDEGGKFEDSGGDWITDLIRFQLVEGYNDVMEGGDGDDVIIGQRGDDTIRGNGGSDLLIGDAGFQVIPENMDMPRIYQVYRALKDESRSDYVVEGVSDKDYGVLFSADYALYPGQYRERDNVGSIVDMLVNADHIITGKNMLRDVLGVSALSTTNGYCMQPMFRVTPGFLYETQRMHGNDVIEPGDGESIVVGDDIRGFAGVDVTDVSYVEDLRSRIEKLEIALGTRLSTMEVDNEFFSQSMTGDYEIKLASDTIATNISGQALVIADDLTVVSRTLGTGSFVSGFFLFMRVGNLDSIMTRFYEVERVMYDLHYALFELHTNLLRRASSTISVDLSGSQTPLHSLVLCDDEIASAGNGDVLVGDSSVLYYQVYRPGISRFDFKTISRFQGWMIRIRMRRSRRSLENTLRTHVLNDLSPTAPLSEDEQDSLPYEDVPYLLSTTTDNFDMKTADNLATGDYGFVGVILTNQDEDNNDLPSFTQSVENLRTQLSLDTDVADDLVFNLDFYNERYDASIASDTTPKIHGDSFVGASANNAIFGEFMTGEAYTQYSVGEAQSRVDSTGNAFAISATSNFDGDYFDVVAGAQVNGQFGNDEVEADTVIPDADLSGVVEKQMKALFFSHRMVETMMENMYYGTNFDSGDAGSIVTGFQCTDPEFSANIPSAADGDITNARF